MDNIFYRSMHVISKLFENSENEPCPVSLVLKKIYLTLIVILLPQQHCQMLKIYNSVGVFICAHKSTYHMIVCHFFIRLAKLMEKLHCSRKQKNANMPAASWLFSDFMPPLFCQFLNQLLRQNTKLVLMQKVNVSSFSLLEKIKLQVFSNILNVYQYKTPHFCLTICSVVLQQAMSIPQLPGDLLVL